MKYNINVSDNGIHLERPSTQQARKIDLYSLLISLATALASIAYIRSIGIDNLESFTPTFFLLGGIAGTIIFLIRTITKGSYLKQFPEKVYFNNSRGVIEISHTASIAKKIEIPYDNVNQIGPRLHTRRNGNNKTSTWYGVAIYLKDGSVWELTEDTYSHQDYAQEWIDKWVNNVTLDAKPFNTILPKVESEKLSVIHRGEELQVKWQNSFPDGMINRLFGPIIFLVFVGFMALTLMSTEGPDLETMRKGIAEMKSVNELPDVLRGFMFVLPLIFIGTVWLLFAIIGIMIFRLTSNQLVVTKNSIAHNTTTLELNGVGVVCMQYIMKNKERRIQFHKEAFHQYSRTETGGTINLTDTGSMQQTFNSFGSESFKDILSESLSSLPKQIRNMEAMSQAIENNNLHSIDFDRFSPLDVYVIKESIALKLGH